MHRNELDSVVSLFPERSDSVGAGREIVVHGVACQSPREACAGQSDVAEEG